jgi:hypothetical protein
MDIEVNPAAHRVPITPHGLAELATKTFVPTPADSQA